VHLLCTHPSTERASSHQQALCDGSDAQRVFGFEGRPQRGREGGSPIGSLRRRRRIRAASFGALLEPREREELSKRCPGSLVFDKNGDVFAVPFLRAVVDKTSSETNPGLRLSLVAEIGEPAQEKKEDWLLEHIDTIVWGIFSNGTRVGARAHQLQLVGTGLAATIELCPNPAGGKKISHVSLIVEGTAPRTVTIGEAVWRLGLEQTPFRGGAVGPALRAGAPIPTLRAAYAAVIPAPAFVGGTPLALLRQTKLALVGVMDTTTSDVRSVAASRFALGLTGDPGLADALILVLACSTATIGAGAPAAAEALRAAREEFFVAMGNLIDTLPDCIIAVVTAALGRLGTDGFATLPGCAGALIASEAAKMMAAAPAPPVHPGPLAPPALLPPGAPPGHPLLPPAAPLSAAEILVASLQAQLAAALGHPPPPSPPALLTGFSFLRPAAVGLAGQLSDLELLVALGGAEVAVALAKLTGNGMPLVQMVGPAAASTAAAAHADFQELLLEARAAAPSDDRLTASTAPLDLLESGARLRVTLRTIQDARATPEERNGLPAGGASGGQQAPASGGGSKNRTKELKAVPSGATPARIERACPAALLNPLCSDEATRLALSPRPPATSRCTGVARRAFFSRAARSQVSSQVSRQVAW
jgi:hypothetical protein